MPLFVCDTCHCVDNTALGGNYWIRLVQKPQPPPQCTECITGEWHNKFPKRKFSLEAEKPRLSEFKYIPKILLNPPSP